MWTISESICLMLLMIASVWDIWRREIPVYMIGGSGMLSLIYCVMGKGTDILLVGGGILVGVFFLIISKVTEEGMGYGDSLLILVLGCFLGFWDLLFVLSISFFLLLCVLIPVLWMKKMSRNYALPFLPFLTGGYLCFLLMGGVGS